MIKNILHPLFLILAGLCIALLLAEGFIRVFYPYSRDHVVPGGLFVIDNYLGWKLANGISTVHQTRYFEVSYRINDMGYRDKQRKPAKDEESYRILIYGDSQVFGWGVPAEERFSNLVENQQQHLEVWNMAVPGYGIDQEVLSYEKSGNLLNANEVFFFVSRATLNRANTIYIYRKYKPKYEIDHNGGLQLISLQGESSFWTELIYKTFSPFHLPYFVDRQFAILKQAFKEAEDEADHKTVERTKAIGMLQKRILARARNLAREREQRITIITDLGKTAGEEMKEFCDKMGMGILQIPIKKTDPAFRFGKHDAHWNLKAHKLVARQLLSTLEANSSRLYGAY